MILKNTSQTMSDWKLHLVVAPSSPFQENLGKTLLSLTLLLITPVLLVVGCILNLLWLVMMILKKLGEQLRHMGEQELTALYTRCRSEGDQKNTTSTSKKSQTHAWTEDGDSHLDSTLAYSEMPGGPKIKTPQRHYINKNHEKAMKKPINQDKLRKAGL